MPGTSSTGEASVGIQRGTFWFALFKALGGSGRRAFRDLTRHHVEQKHGSAKRMISNVTMEGPNSRVVKLETNNGPRTSWKGKSIPLDWVDVVVGTCVILWIVRTSPHGPKSQLLVQVVSRLNITSGSGTKTFCFAIITDKEL